MSEINNIKTSNQALLNSTRNIKTRDANNSTQAQDVAEQTSTTNNDKVSLTDTATQLQSLRQVIADSPEVNADRVAELRAAIANGSYTVDSEALAQNFIKSENQF